MAIRDRRISGNDCVHFVDWPGGRRVVAYYGSASKPESARRALLMEADAGQRRRVEIGGRLNEFKAHLKCLGSGRP